jgi:hypothetical protein
VNWYRSGDPNAPVPPSTQSISDDGTCSASVTCYGSTFGNCCSSAGWCGSTSAYVFLIPHNFPVQSPRELASSRVSTHIESKDFTKHRFDPRISPLYGNTN